MPWSKTIHIRNTLIYETYRRKKTSKQGRKKKEKRKRWREREVTHKKYLNRHSDICQKDFSDSQN